MKMMLNTIVVYIALWILWMICHRIRPGAGAGTEQKWHDLTKQQILTQDTSDTWHIRQFLGAGFFPKLSAKFSKNWEKIAKQRITKFLDFSKSIFGGKICVFGPIFGKNCRKIPISKENFQKTEKFCRNWAKFLFKLRKFSKTELQKMPKTTFYEIFPPFNRSKKHKKGSGGIHVERMLWI